MVKKINILYLLVLFLFFGCKALQKNKDKIEHSKMEKKLISNCEKNKYNKSIFPVKVVDNKGYTYYEIDSVRIYLSTDFALGFFSNNKTDAENFYLSLKSDYGKIFSDGFITGKTFACENYKDCVIPTQKWFIKREGKIVEENIKLYEYEGQIIKILNIKEKKELSSQKNRVFEIWATTNKMESGWGSFSVYFLELKNDSPELNPDFNTFLDGAYVNCFRYAYSQI